MKPVVHKDNGSLFGTFDGEYIYNPDGEQIYRIDEDEVYNMKIPCEYMGSYENGKINWLSSKVGIQIGE